MFVHQREDGASDTWTCFVDSDGHFCPEIEKSFVARRVSQNTFPSENAHSKKLPKLLWSYRQSSLSVPHIVIAFNYFTLFCNVISVLAKLVNFAKTGIGKLCNCKLITVYLKHVGKKDAKGFALKSEC